MMRIQRVPGVAAATHTPVSSEVGMVRWRSTVGWGVDKTDTASFADEL